MKKQIMAMLMALVMMFSLAACNDNKTDEVSASLTGYYTFLSWEEESEEGMDMTEFLDFMV